MNDDDFDVQLSTALAVTDKWYDAFAQSSAFAQLTDAHRDKAGAIVDFFCRYTCQHLGVLPHRWQAADVQECCCELLPRKVTAERAYFEAVAPVLSAFFRFLAEQSFLPDGRRLAGVVEGLHDRIVANSQDRRQWGPAKGFLMAAVEAGVDVQDEIALRTFMLQYNLQMLARANAGGAGRSTPLPPSRPQAARPATRSLVPPYDPCPCGSGKKFKFCCRPAG